MTRKTKEQKAITLIALIITIVVLLILAAVAITAITEYNIIENANSAAQKYGDQANSENTTLGSYNTEIDKYMGGATGGNGSGEGSGSGTGNSKVDTIFNENGTINGEAYSSTNPIIPAGFKAINTDTAKWNEGSLADNVKNGLVISDEAGNEFVWIPVEDINEMAKANVTDGVTNYEGKLYNFYYYEYDSDGNEILVPYDVVQEMEDLNYREPANLTSYETHHESYEDWETGEWIEKIWEEDLRDYAERFTTITWNENFYQESFNKMVESVAKYKGFYVGRYEMSLENGKAQSKAGVTSVYNDSDANNWWGLYEKALTYSSSGVISEMIWGCQYDAMMRWMKLNNIDVTSETPIDTARKKTASYNTTRVTGSENRNDILNNVYDLLGNSREWTQEAYYTGDRVPRGGYYDGGNCPSRRGYCSPTYTNSQFGSRITLYVE